MALVLGCTTGAAGRYGKMGGPFLRRSDPVPVSRPPPPSWCPVSGILCVAFVRKYAGLPVSDSGNSRCHGDGMMDIQLCGHAGLQSGASTSDSTGDSALWSGGPPTPPASVLPCRCFCLSFCHLLIFLFSFLSCIFSCCLVQTARILHGLAWLFAVMTV